MAHLMQLLAYTLIVAVTNALTDDASFGATEKELFKIFNNIQEIKEDGYCCTSLDHVLLKKDYVEPACKNKNNTCQHLACRLELKGSFKNNDVDISKCTEELDNASTNHPEIKEMVDVIKEGCLDGNKYKSFASLPCPALQLEICYYIFGSSKCPKNGCEQTDVCKETCDKIGQIKELIESI